jgi:hypothetical protein
MVKAIARAFRWRTLLETGTHTTVAEIAAAEKINASYVGRVLRLTLLSPEIVEAILDGRQPTNMTLAVLMRPFSVDWISQRTSRFDSSGHVRAKIQRDVMIAVNCATSEMIKNENSSRIRQELRTQRNMPILHDVSARVPAPDHPETQRRPSGHT